MLYVYAPLDGWLVKLLEGWRFGMIVEPMGGNHGRYSVLMHRDDNAF